MADEALDIAPEDRVFAILDDAGLLDEETVLTRSDCEHGMLFTGTISEEGEPPARFYLDAAGQLYFVPTSCVSGEGFEADYPDMGSRASLLVG